ncbi:hypothetical protein AWV79_14225 [Cupriavidus sp. UYMMa02A]|nr:hypothetical protein AWV79_14225 [Cupriavidus sp. UYMMa02A]
MADYAWQHELNAEFGGNVLMRSAVWLTIKESKSSFAIEHEQDQLDRIRRFAAVMERRIGEYPALLSPDTLAELQREIVSERSTISRFGLRASPVFVDETHRFEHIVHYVAPHWDSCGTCYTGSRSFWSAQPRRVPVSDTAITALGDYLVARGFARDPERVPGVALLGLAIDQVERSPFGVGRNQVEVDTSAAVAANTLYRQIKTFFAGCAVALEPLDPRGAQRLAAASTHWLRHTHISHALAAGVPLEAVQQNAGHASLDTTTRYVTTEDARRRAAMKQLWNARTHQQQEDLD